MASPIQRPAPQESLQQQFLRLSAEQQRQIIASESARLADYLAVHPEEILPDVSDMIQE